MNSARIYYRMDILALILSIVAVNHLDSRDIARLCRTSRAVRAALMAPAMTRARHLAEIRYIFKSEITPCFNDWSEDISFTYHGTMKKEFCMPHKNVCAVQYYIKSRRRKIMLLAICRHGDVIGRVDISNSFPHVMMAVKYYNSGLHVHIPFSLYSMHNFGWALLSHTWYNSVSKNDIIELEKCIEEYCRLH